MKKILLFIYSIFITVNASATNQIKKQSMLETLKASKVPIKTETSDEGGRSTEGGGGNGGRPKTQKWRQ